MNRKCLVFTLFAFGFSVFSLANSAFSKEKMVETTGVVESISPHSISIRSEHGLFEINTDDENIDLPKNTKVGDALSIFYTMNVKKIAIRKHKSTQKQQPGTKGEEKKNIILDDRVFYSAKR